MPKPPVDDLMKAVLQAVKASGMNVSDDALKKAISGATKSVGRRAPRAATKGAAAAKPARSVPKITPQTATGGRGGKKPPKPPTASAAAPKPSPKPKKPSGGVKKMTRAQKREINVAKHWAERSNYLAESSAKSRAAKEETRAANRAAWAKRQDEMEAKRLAGRKKMKKKEGQ